MSQGLLGPIAFVQRLQRPLVCGASAPSHEAVEWRLRGDPDGALMRGAGDELLRLFGEVKRDNNKLAHGVTLGFSRRTKEER